PGPAAGADLGADPRLEQGVEQVDDDPEDDEHGGGEGDHSEHDGDVLGVDGFVGDAAQAHSGEDGFDDHRAGQDVADDHADHGQQRQRGVAQGVVEQGVGAGGALGADDLDVRFVH